MNEFDNEQIILTDTGKKTRSRIARGIAAGTAALAAVGAVTAAASPEVRNTAKMAFSSPENYYASVLRDEALSRSEKLAELYKTYSDTSSSGTSENGNVTIDLGAELADELEMPSGTKIGFDYSVSAKDESASGTLGISADGVNIIDLSAIFAEQTLYFSVPTVSPAWITATPDELQETAEYIFFGSYHTYDDDGQKKENIRGDVSLFDGTVLTRERTDRIFTKYTDIWLKHTGDVTLTKNKELTSGSGLTVKYTEAAVSLTAADVYDIASDIISEAKTDSDLKAVWTSLGYTSEEYDEMISQAEESLGAKEDLSEGSTEIILYIGSDGKIKGEKITLESTGENNGSNSENSAILYTKGRDFSFEALGTSSSFYSSISDENDRGYSHKSDNKYDLILTGTYSGGKISGGGTFELTEKGAYSYSDEPESDDYDYTDTLSFDINFSDINVKSAGGEPEGTISISGGGSDDASADITLTLSGKSADCRMDFYEDDEKLFGLAISSERSEYAAPEVPTENTFRMTDDEEDLMNYLLTLDMSKFRENVEKARGSLGDSLADLLIEAADEIDSEHTMLT